MYKIKSREHDKKGNKTLNVLMPIADKYNETLKQREIDITPVIYVRNHNGKLFPNMEFDIGHEQLRYTFTSKGKVMDTSFYEFDPQTRMQIPVEECGTNPILRKANIIIAKTFPDDFLKDE